MLSFRQKGGMHMGIETKWLVFMYVLYALCGLIVWVIGRNNLKRAVEVARVACLVIIWLAMASAIYTHPGENSVIYACTIFLGIFASSITLLYRGNLL